LNVMPCTFRRHCPYLRFHTLQFSYLLLAFARFQTRRRRRLQRRLHQARRRRPQVCRYTLFSPASFTCINKQLILLQTDRATRCQTRHCLLLHNSVGTTSIDQSVNQLYFRQACNKTAEQLNTATLSDWAPRQTLYTNSRPENRLIQ